MSTSIALTKDKELVYSSFVLRKNGLEPIGTPDFEQWLECGSFIRKAHGAVHFWIGDWLNYGERQWGEKYLEAIELTGYAYKTLRNDKWVAARIDLSRRRDNLTFDHHATVAELEPEEQEIFLREAVEKKFDNKQFRKYVEKQDIEYTNEASSKKEQHNSIEELPDQIINTCTFLIGQLENLNIETVPDEKISPLFSSLRKTAEKINELLKPYAEH